MRIASFFFCAPRALRAPALMSTRASPRSRGRPAPHVRDAARRALERMKIDGLIAERPLAAGPRFFDVERGRVAAPVAGASEPRALLCAIARSIGDGRTSSLLDPIAGARLRLAAARARPAILRYSTGIQVDSRRHPIQKEGRDGPAALTRRATDFVCVYEGSSRMCPRTRPPPALADLSAPPSRSPRPSTT